jgi:hypothetical protein
MPTTGQKRSRRHRVPRVLKSPPKAGLRLSGLDLHPNGADEASYQTSSPIAPWFHHLVSPPNYRERRHGKHRASYPAFRHPVWHTNAVLALGGMLLAASVVAIVAVTTEK